ncbi:MAG: S8 family serine peptidase [Phycisphaerales bacterium]|nr:S8 family serine peptidase [Phycisphaerales bacterium]
MVILMGLAALASADDESASRGVLVLRPGVSIVDVAARYDLVPVGSIPSRDMHLVTFPIGMDGPTFEGLSIDPDIEDAEVEYDSGDPGPGGQSLFLAGTFADFVAQPVWSHLGIRGAQQSSTGLGVVVAIVDSGVDHTHPGLDGAVIPGGFDFVDGDTDPSEVANGIDENDSGVADEMYGHGTFAAGIVHLVAPDASILPVRVMDADGISTSFLVAQGIFHAIDAGAQVINVSMGTFGESQIISLAVEEAKEAGVLVVASSGNHGTTEPLFPATFSPVIATTALGFDDVRPGFAAYGEHIDVGAPGVDLVSLIPGDAYARTDGTSYAAPLVSGGAALVFSIAPESTSAFRLRLDATSIPVDAINPGDVGLLGSGRIMIDGLVSWWPICDADLNGDGEANIFDVVLYLSRFDASDDRADLNDDGAFDIFDVLEYVARLEACP